MLRGCALETRTAGGSHANLQVPRRPNAHGRRCMVAMNLGLGLAQPVGAGVPRRGGLPHVAAGVRSCARRHRREHPLRRDKEAVSAAASASSQYIINKNWRFRGTTCVESLTISCLSFLLSSRPAISCGTRGSGGGHCVCSRWALCLHVSCGHMVLCCSPDTPTHAAAHHHTNPFPTCIPGSDAPA